MVTDPTSETVTPTTEKKPGKAKAAMARASQFRNQWVAVLFAVAPLVPQVQALLVANPELAGVLVGAVFSALDGLERFIKRRARAGK